MGLLGALALWLVIGAVIGLIARVVLAGDQRVRTHVALGLGILGAVVGGAIGVLLGAEGPAAVAADPWHPETFTLPAVGALIITASFGLALGRRD